MATRVFEVITVDLNGDTVECHPLKIKHLRKFMEAINKLKEIDDDGVKPLDIMVECCDIALQQYAKDKYTTEELEELLDLKTVYRIIEGASGIKLDDDALPNG